MLESFLWPLLRSFLLKRIYVIPDAAGKWEVSEVLSTVILCVRRHIWCTERQCVCADVCWCMFALVLICTKKMVACQNFRNGDERKQHLHDILTKRRIISLLLVMAQDWFVRCVRMQCQASGLGRRIYFWESPMAWGWTPQMALTRYESLTRLRVRATSAIKAVLTTRSCTIWDSNPIPLES